MVRVMKYRSGYNFGYGDYSYLPREDFTQRMKHEQTCINNRRKRKKRK